MTAPDRNPGRPAMPREGAVLFTAFEPSGDAHAAPVISELRRRRPDLRIHAWGGPRMEAAGAEIVERTSEDGVMGLGGFLKAFEMKRTIDRIDRWAAAHPVALHLPVDSPSANFPICKRLRRRGTRTIHLIAPKVWAWGHWRVRKLQRWSDHVLCILPFEPEWFGERGVEASFIGHPVLSKPIDEAAIAADRGRLPVGDPRILILPGSRSGEIAANLGPQLQAFAAVRSRFPKAVAVILAANERIERLIRERADSSATAMGSAAKAVSVERGMLEAAIAWADLAFATSGTVSLDLTRQACPMIGSYAIPAWQMAIANAVVRTPFKLLPNIVAGEEVVPEFVPYRAGLGATPIIEAAMPLLERRHELEAMRGRLESVRATFDGIDTGPVAASRIIDMLEGWRLESGETGSFPTPIPRPTRIQPGPEVIEDLAEP